MNRSYTEFQRQIHIFAVGTVPCPDCGMALPAGGDDQDFSTRQRHYSSQCPGKPAPAAKPMVIDLPDYTTLPLSALKALRIRIRARLLADQNPHRLVGINAILQPAYDQILAAVNEELARREGDA